MIEEFNPDIAHVQNIHHHLTPSILYALKKANIPIVWTLHDYKLVCPNSTFFYGDSICEKCGKSKYYSTLITKCKKGSISASLMSCIEAYAHRLMKVRDMVDMFVAPSKFLKDKLVERGFDNRKVVHIPNFVNAVAEDHSSASGDYFVYAGRLSSEKGVDTLIQAMAQVSNAKLKIAGDGPMRSTLEVLVSELRLQNVEFLGFIDSETLRKVTIDAQFVVVPSKWYENCPYSILESLALGKPVVGARIGGIPELVDDGKNGFLFEPGNAVDLSAKISILVSDSCLRSKMGLNSLERLQAKYSLNGYYEELSKVYELAKM
jgi:glycosyltransferase involved in cell wall biosynthesis